MRKKKTVKGGASELVHWRSVGKKTMCWKDGNMTDLLHSVTCPECLLNHIQKITEQRDDFGSLLFRANNEASKANELMTAANEELSVTKKRCEQLMDLVDVSTQRLADADRRADNERSAVRALAKLV